MYSEALMQHLHGAVRLLPDDIRGVLVLAAQLEQTQPEADIAAAIHELAGRRAEELRSKYPQDVLLDMLRVASGLTSPPQSVIRQKEIKEDLKERYLEAMWDTGNNTVALQMVGISVSAPYIWSKADPEFAARWNDARAFCGMKPYRSRGH